MAFLAKTTVPLEDSKTIKQTYKEKEEQDNNTFQEQIDSTELQDALERIQRIHFYS